MKNMQTEKMPGPQMELNFDSSPEDTYENMSDQELLEQYALKIKRSLRLGRHMLASGKIDRVAIIKAIMNPEQELDELRAIDQESDREELRRTGGR